MLPQKKNLLRRNAWYRQQLLQQTAHATHSGMDTADSHHTNNTHSYSTTVVNKSPSNPESAIIC